MDDKGQKSEEGPADLARMNEYDSDRRSTFTEVEISRSAFQYSTSDGQNIEAGLDIVVEGDHIVDEKNVVQESTTADMADYAMPITESHHSEITLETHVASSKGCENEEKSQFCTLVISNVAIDGTPLIQCLVGQEKMVEEMTTCTSFHHVSSFTGGLFEGGEWTGEHDNEQPEFPVEEDAEGAVEFTVGSNADYESGLKHNEENLVACSSDFINDNQTITTSLGDSIDLPSNSIVEFFAPEGNKTYEPEIAGHICDEQNTSEKEACQLALESEIFDFQEEYIKASEKRTYTTVTEGVTTDGNLIVKCIASHNVPTTTAKQGEFPVQKKSYQMLQETKKQFSIHTWDGTHPEIPYEEDSKPVEAKSEGTESMPHEGIASVTEIQLEPLEEKQVKKLLSEYEQHPCTPLCDENKNLETALIDSKCLNEVSKEISELEYLISQETLQGDATNVTVSPHDDPLSKASQDIQHLVEEIDLNKQIIELQAEVDEEITATDNSETIPHTELSISYSNIASSADVCEMASEKSIGLAAQGQSSGSVEWAFFRGIEKQQACLSSLMDQCSSPSLVLNHSKGTASAAVESAPITLHKSALSIVVSCVQNGQLVLGSIIPNKHNPFAELLSMSQMPTEPTSEKTHGKSHFVQSFETANVAGIGGNTDTENPFETGNQGKSSSEHVARDKLVELERELHQMGITIPPHMTERDSGSAVEEILQTALDRLGPDGDLQMHIRSDSQKKTTVMTYEAEMPGFKGLSPEEIAQLQGQLITKLKDATETIRATKNGTDKSQEAEDEEGTKTPPSSPTRDDSAVKTSQQRESMEEGYIDPDGNVVVAKKMTRIVTTTKTTYDDEGKPLVETEQKVSTETGASNEKQQQQPLIRLKVNDDVYSGIMDAEKRIRLVPITLLSHAKQNIPVD